MNIFCYCLDAKVVERLEGRAGDERVSRSLIFFECHDKNETHVYKAYSFYGLKGRCLKVNNSLLVIKTTRFILQLGLILNDSVMSHSSHC